MLCFIVSIIEIENNGDFLLSISYLLPKHNWMTSTFLWRWEVRTRTRSQQSHLINYISSIINTLTKDNTTKSTHPFLVLAL